MIHLPDKTTITLHEAYLMALKELAVPYPSVPIPAWPRFNEAIGGFRAREFTILCAPTGVGKTTFLANISAELLKSRQKHFVMSVETGYSDFIKRVMGCFEGKDINTGKVVPVSYLERFESVHGAWFKSDLMELSVYENRVPVETLTEELRAMAKAGHKIAMIDNLNFFLEVTRASDSIVEMDRVIHELIILCKQIDIHIIMVMHPRKSEHASGRVESEYDIKGSSTAVQEAHNVILLNRADPKEIQSGLRTQRQRELKFAKLRRRGEYVGRSVWFDLKNGRYEEFA